MSRGGSGNSIQHVPPASLDDVAAAGPQAGGPVLVGRYALFDEIASGGMGTIHLGRLLGSAGFSRVVAVKRMHAQLSRDAEFVSMFRDELRVAGRIQHPNVVGVLDVIEAGDELLLVMEYVHGESVSRLI